METMRNSSRVPFAARAGRLQGVTVPELLWELSSARVTGYLRLWRPSVTKTLAFEDGRIVFAGSDDADERLGEMLVKDGMITLDQLECAARQLGEGRRLGTALISLGYLSPDDLVRSVLAQVRSITLSLIEWQDGDWEIAEEPLPVGQGIQLGVSPGQLILEGIRHARSFSLLRRIVGAPRTRYRLRDDGDRLPPGVGLTDGERLVLAALERSARTVESLCEELVLSSFEVYQALAGFRVLGIAVPARPGEDDAADGGRIGTLDREEFVSVLAALCRQGETGVLHVSRDSIDRTFQIREGRCVFATSSDPDDGLVALLFRRGVISLQDREEVGRRLLTNKRVGALLQEMGVLDEQDVHRAVRSQVRGIVLDTARWQDGDYAFLPGEIPKLEEIVIDETLEELILAATRNVASWSQIVRGAGGLDACLTVAPGYLDALDRMNIGGEEWDLVAALTEPKKVWDVCRPSALGEFRACQTLWALRVLGVVVEVAAPAADTTAPSAEVADVDAAVPIVPDPGPDPEPVVEEDLTVAPEVVDPPAVESPAEVSPAEVAPSEAAPAEAASAEVAPAVDLAASEAEAAASDADPAASEPPADEPLDPELEQQIERFNKGQQLVYRAVRAEVGAGASNFVRFCGLRLGDGFQDLFANVDLMDDGTWDPAGLRAAIRSTQIDDPWLAFQRLIEKEIEMVHVHLGPSQAEALRLRLEEFDRAGART